MSVFSFQTITAATAGLFKEKGSKFHSFAFPVRDEAEVKAALERLRKEYYDARHHCYAFRLGPEGSIYRASDDGEPNHSAGDPILGQLKSRRLTNILVVVVRYFGGVKLGVGGLIFAYRTAAEEALQKCEVVERPVMCNLSLRYDYAATPEVMRLIKEFNLAIMEQSFKEDTELITAVELRHYENLLRRIKLLKDTGTPIISDTHKAHG